MDKLKDYSILYAEDESIIRLNITQQLNKFFKTVYVAKDGKEALASYIENAPDVLILDINMPYIGGLDVARKVRETNRNIPIVILTAYTESTLLLDAVELNLSKYLVKPVSKFKMKEALLNIEEALIRSSENKIIFSQIYYWDKQEKNLYAHDEIVYLLPREKSLLELLIKKYQQHVTLDDIVINVWEDKFMEEISMDTIKKLVSNLRKKLPEDCLKSVYGSGYVLG